MVGFSSLFPKQFSITNSEIKSAKAKEKEIATSNAKKTIAFKNVLYITSDIISITQMMRAKHVFKYWDR